MPIDEARLDACQAFLDEMNRRLDAAEFRESDHPRSEDGKFGSGGGGVSAHTTETKPLSDKQKQVLRQYGEGNSYNVNKYLRDPKAMRAEAKKNFGARAGEYIKSLETDAKTVDAAIKNSKLTSDATLYRGVSDFGHLRDAVANLKPGESFSLGTISSTSRDEKWAKDFMKGQSGDKGMLVIDAPKGSNGLDMGPYARFKDEEQEILLGRGAKFVLSKFDPATNTIRVKLAPEE